MVQRAFVDCDKPAEFRAVKVSVLLLVHVGGRLVRIVQISDVLITVADVVHVLVHHKRTFKNDEFDSYTRYSYTSCDSCIVLEVKDKILVISGIDHEDTKEMYDELVTITAK